MMEDEIFKVIRIDYGYECYVERFGEKSCVPVIRPQSNTTNSIRSWRDFWIIGIEATREVRIHY